MNLCVETTSETSVMKESQAKLAFPGSQSNALVWAEVHTFQNPLAEHVISCCCFPDPGAERSPQTQVDHRLLHHDAVQQDHHRHWVRHMRVTLLRPSMADPNPPGRDLRQYKGVIPVGVLNLNTKCLKVGWSSLLEGTMQSTLPPFTLQILSANLHWPYTLTFSFTNLSVTSRRVTL